MREIMVKDRAEAMARMAQFDGQVHRLLGKSFVNQLREDPGSFTLKTDKLADGSWSLELQTTDHDGDPLEAFLMVLRQFYQDRDAFSFRAMRAVYQSGHVPEPFPEQFLGLQAGLGLVLDRPIGMRLEVAPLPKNALTDDPGRFFLNHFQNAAASKDQSGVETFRQVFETFLYGTYAHADVGHQAKIALWASTPMFGFFKSTFYQALIYFVWYLEDLAAVNREAVQAMQAPTSPPRQAPGSSREG